MHGGPGGGPRGGGFGGGPRGGGFGGGPRGGGFHGGPRGGGFGGGPRGGGFHGGWGHRPPPHRRPYGGCMPWGCFCTFILPISVIAAIVATAISLI